MTNARGRFEVRGRPTIGRGRAAWVALAACCVAASTASGCDRSAVPVAMPPAPSPRPVPVEPVPVAPAEPGPSRRLRRLTAEQFAASLEVATGRAWSSFEQHAATLGRPDFVQSTEQGEQFSAVFLRIVDEAAREVCADAVRADRSAEVPANRPILGSMQLGTASESERRANLRRLLLRFHGHDVTRDDDPRLAPWLELLDAPIEPSDLGDEGATAQDVEALRWQAVCVGLVTHLDFLTY